MEMNKKINLKLPPIPNSIIDDQGRIYYLDEFTEEELKKVGEEWTKRLINKRETVRCSECGHIIDDMDCCECEGLQA